MTRLNVERMRTWSDADFPTPGATPATPGCLHYGHEPGEWRYSCCACSGLSQGCAACGTDANTEATR